MTTFVVTYPARDGARFDAAYYVATHMPLVRAGWARYGLTSAAPLIPNEPAPAYAAIALLTFETGAALDRALAAPEAATVFGDVANFTDITPVAVRCEVE